MSPKEHAINLPDILDENTCERIRKAASKRTGGRWVYDYCPRPEDPDGRLPEYETCEGCPATPDCPECSAVFVWEQDDALV